MKILFDLSPIQSSANGANNGGSEYCKSVLMYLFNNNYMRYVDIVYDAKLEIQENISNILNQSGVKMLSYNSHKELSEIINKYSFFYSAMAYTYYDLDLKPDVCFIYTIHGLRDIEKPFDKVALLYNKSFKYVIKYLLDIFFPNVLPNRARMKINKLVKVTKNRKIIVPSLHTKYSLLTNLNELDENEITVCYSPAKSVVTEKDYVLEKENYILMVSGDRWLKNNMRAAQAIDVLIRTQKIDTKVVITGVKNKKIYCKNLTNIDNFIFYDYVKDEQLEKLYRNARLFVYPSLNEGFGYPPIEAMKYGTLCVCACDTSISEICGDSVIYFNPYDVLEIETKVYQAFSDEQSQRIYRDKALKKYQEINVKQNDDLRKLVDIIVRNC